MLALHERAVSDIKLMGRALKERWPMSPERRARIITTLCQIVDTDTFEVEKVECEGGNNGEGTRTKTVGKITMPNHRNQIAAAKTLIAADALNQSDEHLADKNHRLDSGQATETVQHVRRVVLQIEGTCQTSSPTTT